MSELNQTISSFVNGVSQQAPEARHPTQVEEMVNCTVSFVDGTRRRPPLEFIKALPELDDKKPYLYSYERGDGEEAYIVAIIDGAWFVYTLDEDLEGQKVDDSNSGIAAYVAADTYANGDYVVHNSIGYTNISSTTSTGVTPAAGSCSIGSHSNREACEGEEGTWTVSTDWRLGTVPYLFLDEGAIPRESFSSTTVGDTTFIVNKTVTVEESNVSTHGISDENYHKKFAYYWVKRTYIAYGGDENQQTSTYQYRIENEQGTITVPSDLQAASLTGANAFGKNSLTVANTLAAGLNGDPNLAPVLGLTFTLYDGIWNTFTSNTVSTPDFTFFDNNTRTSTHTLESDMSHSVAFPPLYEIIGDVPAPSATITGYFRPTTAGVWDMQLVSTSGSYLWIGNAGESVAALQVRITNAGTSQSQTASGLVIANGSTSPTTTSGTTTSLSVSSDYPIVVYWGFTAFSNQYPSGGGVELSHKAPSGSAFSKDWTGLVAQSTALFDPIIPNSSSSNSGSILRQQKNNVGKWNISDTFGNQASEGWWGYVRKVQDLPEDMGDYEGVDTLIKVTGDEKNNFEGFWTAYSDGVWKESVQTGIKTGFKANTMPHTLIRSSLTDFTFKPYTFDERKVGDDFSNPMPSFVGHKIEDLFFYRNRLGMISQDSIILSEVGIYENFFRTTVTDLLASDTIDVSVDSNKVVSLKYAIPFKRNLLLFGANAQYILSGENELRPDNISISQSTEYQLNPKTKPRPIGSNTYFTVNKGEGTQVREYYNVPTSIDNIADDITAHVSDYIPKNAIDLEVSDKYDMIFILSAEDGAAGNIYVYNQTWEGDKKAQSAWHRWEVGTANTNILAIRVVGDDLYLICHAGVQPEAVLKKISLARVDFANEDHRDLIDDPANSDADPNNNTVAEYFSYIQLSEWGFNAGGQSKTDDKQGRLQVRKIELQTRTGSEQKIQVQVGNASTTRKGDGAFVMGEAQNTKLTIKSVGNKGFCVDSVNLKGRFSSRSRTV